MARVVIQTLAGRAGLGKNLVIESAGTHAQHIGEKIDPRAQAALLRRGYDVGSHKSRKVVVADFAKFDLILAMDSSNLAYLSRQCPAELRPKLQLFLQADSNGPLDVPDPYYGNADGFDRVLNMCESGARQWLVRIAPTTGKPGDPI